jgi:hypothetical protein
VEILEKRFRNLGFFENTLNPKRHAVFDDRPKGLAVDYIMGRNVRGRARVCKVDVSDHLPIEAEIRF